MEVKSSVKNLAQDITVQRKKKKSNQSSFENEESAKCYRFFQFVISSHFLHQNHG